MSRAMRSLVKFQTFDIHGLLELLHLIYVKYKKATQVKNSYLLKI